MHTDAPLDPRKPTPVIRGGTRALEQERIGVNGHETEQQAEALAGAALLLERGHGRAVLAALLHERRAHAPPHPRAIVREVRAVEELSLIHI